MPEYISSDVLDVLKTATCNGFNVQLNCPQLERKLYCDVNEVLTRLGGKWKGGKTKAHVFPFDPSDLFLGVVESGTMPEKNQLAFFATPEAVAKAMLSLVGDLDDKLVLEPSAGTGAIASIVLSLYPQALLKVIEIDSFRASILRSKGFDVVESDFLSIDLPSFDAILMNPPFSVESDKNAYIAHIEKAFDLLVPGGRLAAIAPSGFTFRSDGRSKDFRALVEKYGGWHDNGAGAFKASGTGVNTVLLWLDKPKSDV